MTTYNHQWASAIVLSGLAVTVHEPVIGDKPIVQVWCCNVDVARWLAQCNDTEYICGGYPEHQEDYCNAMDNECTDFTVDEATEILKQGPYCITIA